jgi:hypothetical protein
LFGQTARSTASLTERWSRVYAATGWCSMVHAAAGKMAVASPKLGRLSPANQPSAKSWTGPNSSARYDATETGGEERDTWALVSQALTAQALRAAVATLTPSQRESVELNFLRGLPLPGDCLAPGRPVRHGAEPAAAGNGRRWGTARSRLRL